MTSRPLVLAGYAVAAVGFAGSGAQVALAALGHLSGPFASAVAEAAFVLSLAGLAVAALGRGPALPRREQGAWALLLLGVVATPLGRFVEGASAAGVALLAALLTHAGFALLLASPLAGRGRGLPWTAAVFAIAASGTYLAVVLAGYERDGFYLTFPRFLYVLAVTLYAAACALAVRAASIEPPVTRTNGAPP